MNTATSLGTAGASGGAAAALVVILVWLASLVHVTVPADVAAALGTLIGVGIHWRAVQLAKAPKDANAVPAAIPTGPAIVGALLLALLCTSGLSACSTAGTSTTAPALTQAQTDQRTAYKELVFARLAVDDAAGVAGTKGMSPDLIAKIKAGGDAVASAIGTQTTSLESDGSIGSQSLAAVSSALDGALHNLGPILTSAHGTSATPLEMAMAGGQAAMSDVPAVIALVANLTDPSWVPTSDVLKQAAADLTAAQARLDAVGNPAPAASS